MVLIFSHQQDPTTDLVIEWLIAKNVEYRRINSEALTDSSHSFFCDPRTGKLALQGSRGFDSDRSPIKVCWYRRWNRVDLPPSEMGGPLTHRLRYETKKELASISRFLFHRFSHLPWLTDPEKAGAEEKLLALRIARKNGLNVPKSIITNRKDQLLKSFGGDEHILSKPLGNPSSFIDRKDGVSHRTFTESLDRSRIEKLPYAFFPSFFQERIEKSYEVRAFYLDGSFYTNALLIFNSSRPNTQHDHGPEKGWPRMTRTLLPPSVKEKLILLMQELGLNSGSLQLLVKPDGTHFFLKVAPIPGSLKYDGPIDHALERRIAYWLYQKDQQDENRGSLVP